jgi:hypothetical protein
MVTEGPGSPRPRWTIRDWLAAAGLFLATAGVIFWQNAHVAVLWDLSYVLDTAARISLGQVPYRDFPFAHAPLTFLIQAAIIRLTGRVIFHPVVYVATVGGLATVLTWRIALHSLRGRVDAAWTVALLLAAPLTVLGIYCILPTPSYDCDCAFSILVAVWLLQRLTPDAAAEAPSSTRKLSWAFATGPALCLPLFFKQNIGLPFLAISIAAVLLLLCVECLVRPKVPSVAADRSHALKGHGFTGCGKTRPDSEIRRLCKRARLQPGHKRNKINVGFSPCKTSFRTKDQIQAFFRNLFSRAANTAKSTRALAPEVRLPGSQTPILLAILAGVAATLQFATLMLHFTVGVGNYFHWTIQFAAQRRLPGLQDMLGVYRDPNLLWTLPCVIVAIVLFGVPHPPRRSIARSVGSTLPWTHIAALALLAAPFLFTLYSLFLYDDADERGDTLLALWPLLLILATALALFNLFTLRRTLTFRAFLPIVLLVTINGTFMSQQLWGSTYAIWPLLIVLIAEMIAYLDRYKLVSSKLFARANSLAPVMAAVISATLLVCGSFYTASEERLSYVQFPDAPVEHSAFPQLRGLAAPGPFLPNFDELLRYASANIPFSDGLILLPGEDPFYFVTGRTPRFPVLLFDPATDPYSPAQVVEEARLHQIRWLIAKRELQIKEDPTPQREATLKLLMSEFTLSAHLHGYDVYRR